MLESPVATVDEVKRLTVDMSADDHRQLKLSAIVAGTTVRELVLRALRREGIIGGATAERPQQGAFATGR
jgi:hypothetical protein